MSDDEEARAAAYRAQAVKREAFEKAQRARLAGDPVARAELAANWQPIVDWNDQLRSIPDADQEGLWDQWD